MMASPNCWPVRRPVYARCTTVGRCATPWPCGPALAYPALKFSRLRTAAAAHAEPVCNRVVDTGQECTNSKASSIKLAPQTFSPCRLDPHAPTCEALAVNVQLAKAGGGLKVSSRGPARPLPPTPAPPRLLLAASAELLSPVRHVEAPPAAPHSRALSRLSSSRMAMKLGLQGSKGHTRRFNQQRHGFDLDGLMLCCY